VAWIVRLSTVTSWFSAATDDAGNRAGTQVAQFGEGAQQIALFLF
jgi:hypothetical protein